jgi:lysozyme family protein
MKYKDLKAEYKKLWDSASILPKFTGMAKWTAQKILDSQKIYEDVAKATHIPWEVIGCIHHLECSGRFDRHLHNGDPLTDRTKHVPAGRPKGGCPPYSWRESAEDALKDSSLVEDCIEGKLYFLELYNGMGYRRHNIPSPYLWSGTSVYTKGKYVADGKFDPEAVSKQCGAAAILKEIYVKAHGNLL